MMPGMKTPCLACSFLLLPLALSLPTEAHDLKSAPITKAVGGIMAAVPPSPFDAVPPAPAKEKQLRIRVEWIEMPQEKFHELTAEADPENPVPFKSSNDGALRKELGQLIANKAEGVRMINSTEVLARSGQRAKIESIAEFIYPTEYDPALVEKSVGENKNRVAELYGNRLPTPTSFETRNVGATLEVDPVIGGDDRTIDLNLAPEVVYVGGETEWGDYESDDGELTVKMPMFYTMKVTTQVTMRASEYVMIGVNSPMNVETGMPDFEKKVAVFVKADLLVVGLEPKAKKDEPKKAKPQPAEKPKAVEKPKPAEKKQEAKPSAASKKKAE